MCFKAYSRKLGYKHEYLEGSLITWPFNKALIAGSSLGPMTKVTGSFSDLQKQPRVCSYGVTLKYNQKVIDNDIWTFAGEAW